MIVVWCGNISMRFLLENVKNINKDLSERLIAPVLPLLLLNYSLQKNIYNSLKKIFIKRHMEKPIISWVIEAGIDNFFFAGG